MDKLDKLDSFLSDFLGNENECEMLNKKAKVSGFNSNKIRLPKRSSSGAPKRTWAKSNAVSTS
jgi:hypothetical protein